MAFTIRRANYFNVGVKDQPGEGYRLLSDLAGQGVNLLAFTAVPVGPARTQFALFPEDEAQLVDFAPGANLTLDGPHPAILVRGDDELGMLASIHQKLFEADVDVYASSGVSDGAGTFGYVIYMKPDQLERSMAALAE